MGASEVDRTPAQLLRQPYHSTPTNDEREYLLYLPAGYDPSGKELWPVILFLHGGGERGDGREELNYVIMRRLQQHFDLQTEEAQNGSI